MGRDPKEGPANYQPSMLNFKGTILCEIDGFFLGFARKMTENVPHEDSVWFGIASSVVPPLDQFIKVRNASDAM